MNTLKLLAKLRDYPVVTVSDVERIAGKPRSYSYLCLQRLKKAGLIKELENGRYTVHSDPFLVASRIVWPSYVSGWAALQYHHLTEQLPNTIEVVTTRSRKRRKLWFMNVQIVFSRVVVRNFFGFEKVRYGGFPIFVADKEKALLDALRLKRISPSEFSEIVKNNRKKLSIRKMRSYSRRMSNLLYMKVGKLVAI